MSGMFFWDTVYTAHRSANARLPRPRETGPSSYGFAASAEIETISRPLTHITANAFSILCIKTVRAFKLVKRALALEGVTLLASLRPNSQVADGWHRCHTPQ